MKGGNMRINITENKRFKEGYQLEVITDCVYNDAPYTLQEALKHATSVIDRLNNEQGENYVYGDVIAIDGKAIIEVSEGGDARINELHGFYTAWKEKDDQKAKARFKAYCEYIEDIENERNGTFERVARMKEKDARAFINDTYAEYIQSEAELYYVLYGGALSMLIVSLQAWINSNHLPAIAVMKRYCNYLAKKG